jgi:hypothetical protein
VTHLNRALRSDRLFSIGVPVSCADRALGVDLCAGYRKNFDVDVFRESHSGGFGTTFRWRPTANTEIVPFWSYIVGGARQIVPVVYTDGIVSLPLYRTGDLGTQDWTTWAPICRRSRPSKRAFVIIGPCGLTRGPCGLMAST